MEEEILQKISRLEELVIRLERLLTTKDADKVLNMHTTSKLLNVSSQTVIKYVDEKGLPCLPRKKGDSYRFKLDEVENWMNSNRSLIGVKKRRS